MAATRRLFFFGTLMDADVVSCVIGRKVDLRAFRPAVLSGFKRVPVINASYCVILPQESSKVSGLVMDDFTDAEIKRLDDYETDQYIRTEMNVSLTDTNETALAWVYSTNFELIGFDPDGSWSFENWLTVHKKTYMKQCFDVDV